jgi:hypothetical protein
VEAGVEPNFKPCDYFNRANLLNLRLSELIDDKERLFRARFDRFCQLTRIGRWNDAQAMWDLLDPMGRAWSRAAYSPGNAEQWYAVARFWQGSLDEPQLAHVQQLAEMGNNPPTVREIYSLRGRWRIEQGDRALAAESLNRAVEMAPSRPALRTA